MSSSRLASVVLTLGLMASVPLAQEPKRAAEPKGLQESIATALRSNPEVLLAEAKLRQAQAEVNRVRLEVTRDVIAIENELKKQAMLMRHAMDQLNHVQALANAATASHSDVMRQEMEVTRIGAEVANLEATRRYLLGIGGSVSPSEPASPGPAGPDVSKRPPGRPGIPEAYREKLLRTVNIDLDNATVADFVKAIGQDLLVIDRRAQEDLAMEEYRISLSTDNLTVGALLQLLADQYGLAFVFRDYGILVTTTGYGTDVPGPAIPPDLDFAR